MNTDKQHTSAKAFTLVELLAVIAIVGVLAAIIIPVGIGVRNNAQQTRCASNLRQLTAGMLLYATENKGRLPPAYNATAPDAWWRNILYLKIYSQSFPTFPGGTSGAAKKDRLKDTVFACPASDPDTDGAVGFGINRDLYRYGELNAGTMAQGDTIRVYRINQPAKTCLFIENKNEVAGGNGGGGSDISRFTENTAPLSARHGGKLNIAFLDGHVETRALSQIPDNNTTAAGVIFWRGQ